MVSKDEHKTRMEKAIAAAEAAEAKVAQIRTSPEYLAEEKQYIEANTAWMQRLDAREARKRDIAVRMGVWLPHRDGEQPSLAAGFVAAIDAVTGINWTEAQEVKWRDRTSRYATHPYRMVAEELVRRACKADAQWCALEKESLRLCEATVNLSRPMHEKLQAAEVERRRLQHDLPSTAEEAKRAAAAYKAQTAHAAKAFAALLSGEITLAIPAPTLTVDTPQVTIPEDQWRREDDNDYALLAQLVIDGVPFHVTAIAICKGDDGMQHACDPAEEWRLDALADIGHAGGAWQTSTIRGREYVIFASPHC